MTGPNERYRIRAELLRRRGILTELICRGMELRYNESHDPGSGRFTSGGGSGKMGKTKYAPSPQRNHGGVQLGAKKYARLCGALGTKYPGLNAGEIRHIRDVGWVYTVKADGYGGMAVMARHKIK